MAEKKNRNDTPSELTVVGKDRMDFLAQYTEKDTSLDLMEEYKILPRIKVIQQMSNEDLKDQFGEGSLIITPGGVRLCKKKDEQFAFVPLFFFPEWCLWSDRRDKGNPMIQERTFEKSHEIALRSADPERRFEIYQGGPDLQPFKKRYVAHLNFVGMIYGDHPASGATCTLSFSRGEYGKGKAFISAAKLRRIGTKQAPLWSQVWLLSSNLRERGDKKWYGIDYSCPQDPLVLKEEMEGFFGMHTLLKSEYEKKILIVNREDEGADSVDDDDVVDMAANTKL